jgi:hypothetical protein
MPETPQILVCCVPLSEFSGQLPPGFFQRTCPVCGTAVVVSPLSLKVEANGAKYWCNRCVARQQVMQEVSTGQKTKMVRMPGTLKRDAPVQQLIDRGILKESSDPFFKALPELTDEDLEGLP